MLLQNRTSQAASARILSGLRFSRGMRFFKRRTSSDTSLQASGSHLGKLYETAKETFKDGRPVSESEIATVRELIDAVPLKEMGMEDIAAAAQAGMLQSGDRRGFLSRFSLSGTRVPTITYLHICETKDFCLGIFCFPKGTDLPFHDHPSMTVFSRVLYGRIWAKGYDWMPDSKYYLNNGETQPATLSLSKQVTAEDPSLVLYPRSGGNIHNFYAESNCAILDLLTPPYDTRDPGRDCSYYKVIEEAGENGSTGTLQKIPDPKTLRIVSSMYTGIQLE